MYREHSHELVHTFVHAAVELRKWCQIFLHLCTLGLGLLQKPLGNHVPDVLAGDQNLLIAVLHTPQAVCNERKSRAVEDGLLDARNESELQVLADLTQFPQEVQVQNQRLVFSGS